MGYENSKWARAQLKFLKGGGAGAAKVLLMAMSEAANNTDPQWFGQDYELFENCGIALRSGERGFELLKAAGLIIREKKGNQHKGTTYRLCREIILSEPAILAHSERVNPPIRRMNPPKSTSEPAKTDTVCKEEPSINRLQPSNIPQPSKPQWLEILEAEVPKTQHVKWIPRWSELLMIWWADQDQAKMAEPALRAARALAGHSKKYLNYNLVFQNWAESEINRNGNSPGPPTYRGGTRVDARGDPEDFSGKRW